MSRGETYTPTGRRPVRLLCSADLHIGRRPTSVPPEVGSRYACHQTPAAVGEVAERIDADAVLIAGDLIDADQQYYAAYASVEALARRLAARGVPLLLVAGNHDAVTLGQLIDRLHRQHPDLVPCVRLLGRGGRWEAFDVTARTSGFGEPASGRPRVRVAGWSFPTHRVTASPLAAFPTGVGDDGVMTVGMVHGDVYDAQSPYAPLSLATLRDTRGVAFWLLGHIHRPHVVTGTAWGAAGGGMTGPKGAVTLYPGSPRAMDPGEPGVHGFWQVDLPPGRPPVLTSLPLIGVRYERVEFDMSDPADPAGCSDPAGSPDTLRETFDAWLGRTARHHLTEAPGDVLSYRVRVVGRSAAWRTAIAALASVEQTEQPVGGSGVADTGSATVYVERVEFAVGPPLDLGRLAGRRDAVGSLASILLDVRQDHPASPDTLRLLRTAADRARQVANANAFAGLNDVPFARADTDADTQGFDVPAVRQVLFDQGLRLLGALFDQGASGDVSDTGPPPGTSIPPCAPPRGFA